MTSSKMRWATGLFFMALVCGMIIGSERTVAQNIKKIGTFDSRAIAVAYYNSKDFRTSMSAVMSEMDSISKNGDKKAVAKIERDKTLRQAMMHEQGFGTGSVSSIVDLVKDKIKAIAEKENLSTVVSKWELVYSGGEIELVDITEQLVALFGSDERMKQMTKELQKTEPVKDAYLIDD